MSVDISYKKQSALFLILIVIVFFVVEGSARSYEFFLQDGQFTFDSYDFKEKNSSKLPQVLH